MQPQSIAYQRRAGVQILKLHSITAINAAVVEDEDRPMVFSAQLRNRPIGEFTHGTETKMLC